MSDSNNAVKVKGVYKNFKLPHQRKNSIKSIFTGILDRKTVQKKYKIQHALKDISFEIKKGEFFGIVGKNGGGKSTMLKMLAGIYQPTSGTISITGRLVPFIELGVGFNPELSGRENVYLNGALLNFSVPEIDEMYNAIVEFAELEKFMDQKLKNYSSGMQVRLAFSLAIRAKADILLIDEVLAVGDADFQRKCFEYFRNLKKNKKTVVFVSHDMSAVTEYCDRAMLIDKGEVKDIGKPEEISKLYNQLFSGADNEVVEQKGGDRWGDRRIEVKRLRIGKTVYQSANDDVIKLSVVIHANEAVTHNLAVGFLIKNSADESILGTNTHVQHIKIKPLAENKEVEVSWKIPNVFGEGNYVVDCAITSTDGTIAHDWWDHAANFKVYRDEYSPYIITPSFTTDVRYLK